MSGKNIWISNEDNEDDEDMQNVKDMLENSQDAIRTAFSGTKRTLDDVADDNATVKQKVITIDKVNRDFNDNPVESLKRNVAPGVDRQGLELWAATGKAQEVVNSLAEYERVTTQLFENPYYTFISKIEGYIHKKDAHYMPGVTPNTSNIPTVKKQPNAGVTVQLDANSSIRINSTNNVSGIGAGGPALSNIKSGQFSAEALQQGGEDEYTRKVLGLADTTRVTGKLKPSDSVSIAISSALNCIRGADYAKFFSRNEHDFFKSDNVMTLLAELVSHIYLRTDSLSKNSYTHDSYEPRRDKSVISICKKMARELIWDDRIKGFRIATPAEFKKIERDKLEKLQAELEEDDGW